MWKQSNTKHKQSQLTVDQVERLWNDDSPPGSHGDKLFTDYRDVHSEDPETVKDKCGVSIHSSSSNSGT